MTAARTPITEVEILAAHNLRRLVDESPDALSVIAARVAPPLANGTPGRAATVLRRLMPGPDGAEPRQRMTLHMLGRVARALGVEPHEFLRKIPDPRNNLHRDELP